MGAGDGAIFTRHTLAAGSHAISYLRGGAQREVAPVLYLHGFGGGGRWESLHMAMGSVTLVIAPTLPGWQQTEPPDGISNLRDYATVIGSFLDLLDAPPVVLAGHSVGAWVAQYLAVDRPELVSGLVLIDPLGLAGPESVDIGALGEEEFATRAFAKLGMVATANAYGFGAEWQAVRSGPEFERQWKGSRFVARLVRDAWSDPALTERLSASGIPALLVWGKLDGLAPLTQGEELRRRLPGATLQVVDRAAHLPMYERPETVNRLIRNYLMGVNETIPGVVR